MIYNSYNTRLYDRTNIASSVKKNINKLKAQAQAMMSKEEAASDEDNSDEEYDEDNSDEEVEAAGEQETYNIEKRGWQIIFTEEFSTNPHLLDYSPYVWDCVFRSFSDVFILFTLLLLLLLLLL